MRTRVVALSMLVVAGIVVAGIVVATRPVHHERQYPERFGFGRIATAEEIRTADSDVRPDGRGLPHDSGTVAAGELVYEQRCVRCHGATGVEGPFNKLVGRMPGDSFNFGRDPKLLPLRTIGSYWPYATTLYDYVNRAMPFDSPGSLKPHDVYSVVAYLLNRNRIIPANAVMNEHTLPAVAMPSRNRFVPDNRRGGREIR
ncbi:MAG: c-type cytochrome [Gemmatimonadaceae bacterium]